MVMSTLTTLQVAQAARLSAKAVRLYADRGLIAMTRAPATGHREFRPGAVDTARQIALLRTLDLSLAQIGEVLGADDPVSAFDAVWAGRRRRLAETLAAGTYARSVLAGCPTLDVGIQSRQVQEQLTLRWTGVATLGDLPATIHDATTMLFGVLHEQGSDLAGSPFVAYHERATESGPGRVSVHVPVAAPLRPPVSTTLAVEPAHDEVFVALTQAEAVAQPFVVSVHDYLRAGALEAGEPCGDDREVYLPAWGHDDVGPVMDVAVPVRRVATGCGA